MDAIIQTNNLSKKYKDIFAVHNVSITINQGDIYGFIGLNGAGKTTLIRMLLGMIQPTQGVCYIKGEKIGFHSQRIWRHVGYMVESPYAYPELTVKENLQLYQRLRMISRVDAVSSVMDQLHLTRYAQKKAKHLSLGNKQRLGIAKALIHQPDILILDEPVNGLDPAGIAEIRTLIQELALHQGVTILISSHLLNEITKIATRIGIIHEGQLIQEIDSPQLKQLLKRKLVVDTNDIPSAQKKLVSAGYTFSANQHGYLETYDEKAVLHPEKVARFLVHGGIPPSRLIVEQENLESYFLRKVHEEEERL